MAGAADPFAKVKAATDAHRARHGCGAYPYDNGPLLAALAAAANARRILELGTALGYTALSFASGAPDSTVDTIERDPEHVQLARDNIRPPVWIIASPSTKAISPSCCRRSIPATTSPFSTATRRRRRCIRHCAGCCAPADADHRQSQSWRHGRRRAQGAVRRQDLAQRAARRRRRDRDQRQAVMLRHWRRAARRGRTDGQPENMHRCLFK